LWPYIVQGVEKLKAGQKFETYWPDQPIRLAMTSLLNEQLLVERSGTSDPDIKVVVDKYEMVDALLAGAATFFDVFETLDTDRDTESVRVLRELKEWRANAA
jgi:hypothetical protein